jgi:hypothetical protein
MLLGGLMSNMQHSRSGQTESVTLVTLSVILVIGLIIGLISFLSFLSGTTREGTKDNLYAKEETRVYESSKREFPTPARPQPPAARETQAGDSFF